MPVSRPSGRPPTLHPYLDGPYPRAYAHRGWHLDELAGLENTAVAFRRAVDEGFAYLELDVHATADGVAVVHHDRTLDRTTDATGPLAAHTAAELDRVRVLGGGSRPGTRRTTGREDIEGENESEACTGASRSRTCATCSPRCRRPGSPSS